MIQIKIINRLKNEYIKIYIKQRVYGMTVEARGYESFARFRNPISTPCGITFISLLEIRRSGSRRRKLTMAQVDNGLRVVLDKPRKPITRYAVTNSSAEKRMNDRMVRRILGCSEILVL